MIRVIKKFSVRLHESKYTDRVCSLYRCMQKMHSDRPILTLSWWAPPRKCWDIVSLKHAYLARKFNPFFSNTKTEIEPEQRNYPVLRHIFFEHATCTGYKYTVKKVSDIFVPCRDVTLQTLPRTGMSLTFFCSVSTNKEQYVLIVKIIDQPEAPCRLPCWNLQVVKAGGGGDVAESVPNQLVPGKHRAGPVEIRTCTHISSIFRRLICKRKLPGSVEFYGLL